MSSFLGGGGGGSTFPLFIATHTNPLTFFVATTGSDSNNGLTPATAWATLQHSADFISANVLFGGGDVVVNVAAGTYVGFGVPSLVGGGTLQYYGDNSSTTFITAGVPDGFANFGECVGCNFTMVPQFAFNHFTLTANGFNNCMNVNTLVVMGDQVAATNTDLVFNLPSSFSTLVRCIGYPAQLSAAGSRVSSFATINLGAGQQCPQVFRLDFGAQFFDQNQWTVTGGPYDVSSGGWVVADNGSIYCSFGATWTGSATVTGPAALLFAHAAVTNNRGNFGELGLNFFPSNAPPVAIDETCIYDNYFLPDIFFPNTQVSNYSIAISDKNSIVEMNSASPNTVTVELDTTLPFHHSQFPVGSVVTIVQAGTGTTTVVAAAGVTGHNFGSLAAQWATAKLYQRAINEWVMIL